MNAWILLTIFGLTSTIVSANQAIDRFALVTRHNVKIDSLHAFSPLSVGNGAFAFTADVTGLQTFPESYADGIPLTTMAEWGWHSFPNTNGYVLADTFERVDTYGREVTYNRKQTSPAGGFLRANPHQITLGLIGLELIRKDGAMANAEDITAIDQSLDLWKGLLTSRFMLDGQPVMVKTCAHPDVDQVAVQIESPLIKAGRLKVRLRFPGAAATWGRDPADWSRPESHQTTLTQPVPTQAVFKRAMDTKNFFCFAAFSNHGKIDIRTEHEYVLTPSANAESFECLVTFHESDTAPGLDDFETVAELASNHWKTFWTTGGAIDLSGSKDSRWKELERRIVLSQYLTAIQSSQKYPPQETGLTCNSWFGKFHLEMHWWHGVHFALWNRIELLERSLGWYNDILPAAKSIADRQGYKGVRWPKMTNPNGEDSPSGIGPMLLWQQPHPIYYAELVYRQNPSEATLNTYKDVVFETAEFMADFAHWEEAGKRYVLGPPVIPAQENYKHADTWNPTYELCYWQWGLETAQQWRKHLGLPRNEKWDHVIRNLSALPIRNGVYSAIESEPYTNSSDHPSMLGALGLLPKTPLVDTETMRKTAMLVYKTWQWPDTWGWDYPMLAMTAARTGLPELAVDAFFIDSKKNLYWPNGHNYQRENLPLYLPGNGGLLTATAMMAAGWDGAPDVHAPGFPTNGNWTVKWENLKKMP